jgi:hypothetical protein
MAYNLVWRVAIADRRLLRSDVSEETIQKLTRSYRVGVPLYIVATAGAFVHPLITVGICTALWIYWIATSKQR